MLKSCRRSFVILLLAALCVVAVTALKADSSSDSSADSSALPRSAGSIPDLFKSVVWTSPSADYNGSMPLGNGEIGLNAWVNPQGDLEFFISRTDSWDEYGRLLKIGGVRISTGLPKERVKENYVQTLDIETGRLTVVYGPKNQQTKIQLWVDANNPVIVVQIDTCEASKPCVFNQSWRTEPKTMTLGETSDLPYKKTVVIQPDRLLNAADQTAGDQSSADSENLVLERSCIGWYRYNGSATPDFDLNARTQGVEDFPRTNPLQNRCFGAIIEASGATRLDAQTLCLPEAKSHTIEITALTVPQTTPEQWFAATKNALKTARQVSIENRKAQTANWWTEFQNRSWIRMSESPLSTDSGKKSFWRLNDFPLRLGLDSNNGSRFSGTLESVSVQAFDREPNEPNRSGELNRILFQADNPELQAIPESQNWSFPFGGSVQARVRLGQKANYFQRILDRISAGKSDGFLVDVSPQQRLRIIFGQQSFVSSEPLPADRSFTIDLRFDASGRKSVLLDGKEIFVQDGQDGLSDPETVSRAYTLQRYVTACAGRGQYAIKYNGSIFTVPYGDKPDYADYRRWGPGYWWQNTRCSYFGLNYSGDFDLQQTLFRQYAAQLPLHEFRAKKFFGAGFQGAYYPECIYFWGDAFPETYGTELWRDRKDPLQSSPWHKWEFVGGLELAFMALNYYDFTRDDSFLAATALPLADSVTRFFDSYYKTDPATGKLVMNPSQAVETWWDCTNPMPEVAGLQAVLKRLLTLDNSLTTETQKQSWKRLLDKIPDLPVWTDKQGIKRMAPAERFAKKSNIENPELYCVFPFRLISFNKRGENGAPDERIEFAVNALNKRLDRGPLGWRQDELFMAYLGQTDQVQDYIVQRARNKCSSQRFPAFWGPNYDWTPDQCHGGSLMAAVQAMVLQTDGDQIFVLPALPANWNVDFKLRAPKQTVVSGRFQNGRLVELNVTPQSRYKDVVILVPLEKLPKR